VSFPLLSVDRLTVGLPSGAQRGHAVDAASLTLDQGETLCVVGESGSGKSVLALALMGLLPSNLPIEGGSIRFENQELTALSENQYRRLRGDRIGMIFQEPMSALNPVLTIGTQIDGALAAHQSSSSASRRRRRFELLELMKLPRPTAIADRYPHELSGGQRQRVMIAMALANNPRLLIADEPTTALDVTTQNEILQLLAQLRQELNLAILFITHDFGVVADIADRVIVMNRGQVVETGPVQHILHHPEAAYTRKLVAAVPTLNPPVRETAETSLPLLRVESLSKTYHARAGWFGERHTGTTALDGVDLEIARGEVLAVVGESGSGKSTLAQIVAGLLKPDTGTVRLDDIELTALSARERRRTPPKVQMVFQDPFSSLNPRHRVERIITEAPIVHGADRPRTRSEMVRLLELVGLDASAARLYPHAFSGGQRQRIGLARALIMQPQLLIADEPVSALDVSVQKQVLELLAEVRHKLGLAILFITHDLRVASSIADRIVVMHGGRIVEEGSSGSVLQAPKSNYTRSLVAAIPGLSWERERSRLTNPNISPSTRTSVEAPC
jgi:peptide/nickel transport system ATP-binding protein